MVAKKQNLSRGKEKEKMKKQLTKRQVLFLVIITALANKTQRLPSLVSAHLGRHGWLVFILLGIIDTIFVSLALWANKINNGMTSFDLCKRTCGTFIAKSVILVLGMYFFIKALLPFEAVHDAFSTVLFDNLPWNLYSLFFVAAIILICIYGLTTIGRVSEPFVYLFLLSFFVLVGLGATSTDLSKVLPFIDFDITKTVNACWDFCLWFGGFVIIFMFMGRVKEDDGKMGWPIILSIFLVNLVMAFGYVVFYGLYENLCPDKSNFISMISQFSLLDVDIGRIDWLFVLFYQFGEFISIGVYLCLATMCLRDVIGARNRVVLSIIVVSCIYLLDVFLFKTVGEGVSEVSTIIKYIHPVVVLGLPIFFIILAYVAKKKDEKVIRENGLIKYQSLYKLKNKKRKNDFSNVKNVEKKHKKVQNAAKISINAKDKHKGVAL